MARHILGVFIIILLCSCQKDVIEADYLIINGTVVDGSRAESFNADIAIKDGKIIFIGDETNTSINASSTIDAEGLIVSPGFIDSHTHSLGDLKSKDRNANLNYLTQGVTTVINGNDGEGPFDIDGISTQLISNSIGTNTAFLVGHKKVRNEVLGGAAVAPDSIQLVEMQQLVKQGMEQGAYGFSTGLYYAPGSYATTEEVIALTEMVKPYGGLYDSHIRDESSYNIGLINAIKEAIRIGEEAGVPVNLAHIKALGVDVWNTSDEIIDIVEAAQKRGVKVTADQYPWKASGTHIENALITRWVMAGSDEDYYARLDDESLLPRIKEEMRENLRKRGGADALLITADCKDTTMHGKTLAEIAAKLKQDPVLTALQIARDGGARVASFNMNEDDVVNFMKQPWVMTCSDGTKGHPRKYASYPQKYKEYIVDKKVMTREEFVHKSSGLVAQTFGIEGRGIIKEGNYADIIIWDEETYLPSANFYEPAVLTKGVSHVLVNGKLAIDNGVLTDKLHGTVLRKQ